MCGDNNYTEVTGELVDIIRDEITECTVHTHFQCDSDYTFRENLLGVPKYPENSVRQAGKANIFSNKIIHS